MMFPPPAPSLRDILAQHHLQVQQQTLQSQGFAHSRSAGLPDAARPRSEFEAGLSELGREYNVEAVGCALADAPARQPVQLQLTPRSVAVPSFQIRVTGLFIRLAEAAGGILFKPVSVDIFRPSRCRTTIEFQDEADSAEDVIAHVHRVLSLLRHPAHSAVPLNT
ncbi:MAG TPA: hypothetical protein VGE29_12850 [Prosthecobacter sp.]